MTHARIRAAGEDKQSLNLPILIQQVRRLAAALNPESLPAAAAAESAARILLLSEQH